MTQRTRKSVQSKPSSPRRPGVRQAPVHRKRKGRLYVQAATFCESVLIEPGSIVSLIRMVDTFVLTIPNRIASDGKAPTLPTELPLRTNLFLGLKAVDFGGPLNLTLELFEPSGISMGTLEVEGEVEYAATVQTINLSQPVRMTVPVPSDEGVCWADVIHNGRVLTSIPFIIDARLQTEADSDDATAEDSQQSRESV